MATRPVPQPEVQARGALADALITLAGTPDDTDGIDARLDMIARLAADRVAAADYASVTAIRGDEYLTVAATSELAEAVDRAQYADRGGPCLQALADGVPVTVPDVSGTMQWPGFHEAAAGLGLHASVSVPLFTGSGTTIAVLNLYGRDAAAMAPLIAGVWAIYDPDKPLPAEDDALQPLDAGGAELLTGFAEALSVRGTIQLAVAMLRAQGGGSTTDAYLRLRVRAADTGVSLLEAATDTITGAS